MKIFIANVMFMEDEDSYSFIEYEAESLKDAVAIADENDWEYLCEKLHDIDDDDLIDLIEQASETRH